MDLKTENDILKEQIKDLEKVLEENHKLKALNAAKDTFLSIIAHDLKNPLGTLIQLTELLQHKFAENSPEKNELFLGLLSDSSRSAFNLLQNLLVWTRVQTGQLKSIPEKIHLLPAVKEQIASHQLIADKKSISIQHNIDTKAFVYADRFMIKTVLGHLLSNALKYTSSNGLVSIECESIKKDKSGKEVLRVCIEDSGIGMSPEIMTKLFKIESRNAIPGTEGEKGSGLGLLISKALIEREGGEIIVESEPEEGSRFSFTLPKVE